MARDDEFLGKVLLQEYDRLKDEQIQRIGTRDNLIYATLLSLAGVVAATVQAHARPLLLLLPPVCLVLGWTYLANDEKVSAIGRYLRTDLGPRLDALAGEPVLGWEERHRLAPRRRSRKAGQLVAELAIFVVPGCAAVLLYWLSPGISVALVAVSAVEVAAAGVLAYQIVRYAELTGP